MTVMTGLGFLFSALALLIGMLMMLAVLIRRQPRVPPGEVRLPITVLKPLCGDDSSLYETLKTFCVQDYVQYQIVFGLHREEDSALPVVRRLQREFPQLDIAVVINPRLHGSNYKVSNLINMVSAAKHDLLVIADSDIHVGPDYLATIVPPLMDPKTGIVTCIYRARPRRNLWSRLAAQYIDDGFMPSVLLSHLLGGRGFAFGATIALRRRVLEDIGGFAAVVNHLADDCMLSIVTRRRGFKTVLSPYVVETTVQEPDFASLAHHELRWLRTTRTLQPLGYAFSFLMFTVPLALLGVCFAQGSVGSLWLLAGTVAARLALHAIQRHRAARPLFSELWLLPLRDLLTPMLWARAFASREVDWGGHHFTVAQDGSFAETSEP